MTGALESPAPGDPSGFGLYSPHEALRAWRRQEEAAGREGIEAFKDTYLMQIVKGGDLSSPEAIMRRLPGSLAPFAREIAAVAHEAWVARNARERGARDPAPEPIVDDPATQSYPAQVPPPAAPDRPATPLRPQATPAGLHAVHGTGHSWPDPEDDSGFTPFAFGPSTVEPAALRAVAGPSGLALSWPSIEAPVVIYRVVSRDDGPPWSPDEADHLLTTTESRGLDNRPAHSAVRYLQVWANSGADTQDAKSGQPVLIAATAVVNPVVDLDIREEEGTVIGQWSAPEGVRAVQILRVPIARAAQSAGNTAYRILENHPNLGGFVDRAATRGQRFLYQIYAEALVDDVIKLSAPINYPVTVSAALERVGDLQVTEHGTADERLFNLTWTPPSAGKVLIFRSEAAPRAGSETAVLAESALTHTGLLADHRLAHPVNPVGDGRVGMADVPWPRAWNRAYLTPVTVLEDKYVLGTTVRATSTGFISDPKIVERVDRQIVTFSWPAGAASVLMFVGPPGIDAQSAMSGRPFEISRPEWEKLGGLHLRQPLPARGCSLHLLPVAFDDGRRIQGAPCSIEYPFLVRIYYRVEVKRNLLRKPVAVFVSLVSADPIVAPTAFVLVHHPSRFPLDISDGTPLPVSIDGEPGAQLSNQLRAPRLLTEPDGTRWRADVTKLTGFVRLFIDIETAAMGHWALMDPAIGDLSLGGG